MANLKIRLSQIVGLVVLIILLHVSIQMLFIALLLGLLLVPPVVVFASVFAEGTPIIIKGLQSLSAKGERFLLISISKEYIILEPQ